MSLAASILQIVEAAAAREGFERVAALRLSVPALAGVEVEALRFAVASMAPGTVLGGARLDIDEPPGQARCPDCAAEVAIRSRLDACPVCGGERLQVTGGTELRVVDLMVE